MSARDASREVEIKLRVADAASGRLLLREAGFRVRRRRYFESNTVYDWPGGPLRERGALLRLRKAGGITTLTFKGRPSFGKHKTREEIEIEIEDAESLAGILLGVGFQSVFQYEKYRTDYRLEGTRGLATLDETPVGVYIELEGTPQWIDRAAQRLNFTEDHYITKSYGRLYIEDCAARGLAPRHMVFRRRPPPRSAGKQP